MPPRFKFTKDEVINAALDVTRQSGASGLTARALAARLGCSVKPVFGLFKNMEEVHQKVINAANDLYKSYLEEDMSRQAGWRIYALQRRKVNFLSCFLCVTVPMKK